MILYDIVNDALIYELDETGIGKMNSGEYPFIYDIITNYALIYELDETGIRRMNYTLQASQLLLHLLLRKKFKMYTIKSLSLYDSIHIMLICLYFSKPEINNSWKIIKIYTNQ